MYGLGDVMQDQDATIRELKKQVEDLKAENARLNNYIIISDRMVTAYLKAQP